MGGRLESVWWNRAYELAVPTMCVIAGKVRLADPAGLSSRTEVRKSGYHLSPKELQNHGREKTFLCRMILLPFASGLLRSGDIRRLSGMPSVHRTGKLPRLREDMHSIPRPILKNSAGSGQTPHLLAWRELECHDVG